MSLNENFSQDRDINKSRIKCSDFFRVKLPEFWSKIQFRNNANCVIFAIWNDCKTLELHNPCKFVAIQEVEEQYMYFKY